MALGRVVTFVAGTTILAADVNGEINNILNNPISLISPTTGAINFNLSAHTNLIPGALTGSSGAAGNTLQTTGGAAFWGSIGTAFTSLTSGQLLVGASSGGFTTLNIGTTGQVLAVTSSNTNPSWQVIPPGGGLSTGAVSTGAIYYISTGGALVPLTVGTSGQVLTLTTGLLPSWAAAGAGGASTAGSLSTATVTYFDDFTQFNTSVASNLTNTFQYGDIDGTFGVKIFSSGGGQPASIASLPSGPNTGTIGVITSIGVSPTAYNGFLTSLNPDMTFVVANRSVAATRRLGITTSFFTSGDPSDGLYWRTTGTASTWFAVSRNAGTSFTIATTAVGSTDLQVLRIQVSSSGLQAQVFTNGVSAGTFTSSQVPATGLNHALAIGSSDGVADTIHLDAWQIIQNRQLKI